jgi:hypothetical protein
MREGLRALASAAIVMPAYRFCLYACRFRGKGSRTLFESPVREIVGCCDNVEFAKIKKRGGEGGIYAPASASIMYPAFGLPQGRQDSHPASASDSGARLISYPHLALVGSVREGLSKALLWLWSQSFA